MSNIGTPYPRYDGRTGPVYIKIKGQTYDLQHFYEVHPGGTGHLLARKGKEIEDLMAKAPHPHTKYAMEWLKQFKVDDMNSTSKLERIDKYGVDWDKGLLFRVHKIKNYVEWLDDVVYRPLRLFDNEFLEKLTVTKWWMIPMTWVPFSTWAISKSLTYCSPITTLVLVIFGMFAWTLLEYQLHSQLFHMTITNDSHPVKKVFQFALHGQHHKNPFDPGRLAFPPVPCAILVTALYMILRIFVPYKYALPLLAGGIIGYMCYDMIHYYLHHGKPKKGSYMWELAQHHNRHHFVDPMKGLSISNKFWDAVLNTDYSTEEVDYYNGKN